MAATCSLRFASDGGMLEAWISGTVRVFLEEAWGRAILQRSGHFPINHRQQNSLQPIPEDDDSDRVPATVHLDTLDQL